MGEHSDRLINDVQGFNTWRQEHPTEALDFSGQDFSSLDLSGALLMGVKLDGADFSHARLVGTVFAGASLKGASFTNADLTEAVFGPPELMHADLAASPLSDALVQGAAAKRANFRHATVTGAQFRQANVEGADFTNANHADANFRDANTQGAVMPEEGSTLESRVWGTLTGLTQAQKRSYIQSLYTIACVDGDFAEDEQALLFALAQRMELSAEEFEASIPTGSFTPSEIEIHAPEELEIRIQWLRNLILMVAADGVLTPAEYQTCMYFAGELGFPPQIVDDVLNSLGASDGSG
ncbi:MAG: pentapeptide repeat-containing protein [Myxococcota bacterium]